MSKTIEDLQAENERLLTLNDRLSRQLIGMSDRLQESARQIAAMAWDEGFYDGRRVGAEGDDGPAFVNPYRSEGLG